MRKTIMFLIPPLLLLAGCGKNQPADLGADNASPIVVGDTSIPITSLKDKDETTLSRKRVESNNQHFKHKNKYFVHDKEKKADGTEVDSYLAACVTSPALTSPIPIPSNTAKW